MLKMIGGIFIGVFIGSLMAEIVKRERPELAEAIEGKAKEATDMLFEGLREAYDFRENTGK